MCRNEQGDAGTRVHTKSCCSAVELLCLRWHVANHLVLLLLLSTLLPKHVHLPLR
jgi:hypothetical protein